MLDMVTGIVTACWGVWVEAAPYVLFGFFAAGLLKGLLPVDAVARHLGRNNARSVLKASLFGIPLPLCSCGVIPAAISLRKQGASKGASAAFLVSVPETGIDSVAITWALLDPLMTVVRPVASFLTATVTGLLINLLPKNPPKPAEPAPGETAQCGCAAQGPADGEAAKEGSLSSRIRSGLTYAFGDLLADIGKWLLLGVVVAGVIAYAVPDAYLLRYLDNEPLSLLVMLGVGIPLYICASASTPVAAALVLKGLSPGAALVFLLAGPATNAATLSVVGRYFGRSATLIYLASIGVCSLVMGWLTNRLYAWSGLDITRWVHHTAAPTDSPVMVIAGVVLALLLLRCFLPRRRPVDSCCPPAAPGGT